MASPLGGDGSPARRAVDAALRTGQALVDKVLPGSTPPVTPTPVAC
ncbi:hypothetical protein [Nocardioides zeae]